MLPLGLAVRPQQSGFLPGQRRGQPQSLPRADSGLRECPSFQSQAEEDHLRELRLREEARVPDVLVRPLRGPEELWPGAPACALSVELQYPGSLRGQGRSGQFARRGGNPGPPSLRKTEVNTKHVDNQVHEETSGDRAGKDGNSRLGKLGHPRPLLQVLFANCGGDSDSQTRIHLGYSPQLMAIIKPDY